MKKKLLLITLLVFLCNCEAIFVENISEKTVILLAPVSKSEVASGTIQFNWQEVLDATKYKIQIAKPSFSAASQILLDSLTSSSIISKNLEVGDYEWRVKALNSDFSTNY
ncbi:MAG: hypothetical protein ACWIPJ_06130, partial [Polaribacter sp.]